MSEFLTPKVLVIGGGPGGYVAAIRAGQLGLDTVLVDVDRLGGTCLVRGCIPSKALIHAASLFHEVRQASDTTTGRFGIRVQNPELDFRETVAWKDGIVDRLSGGVAGLLRKNKVRTVKGWATFSDAKTCSVETDDGIVSIKAENVILATGSAASQLPSLPFGGRVISSTDALSLEEVPTNLVVIGAGYIGLELGIAYAKLGSKVTVVEAQDRILALYDSKLTAPVSQWLDRHGVTVHLGAKALGLDGEQLLIESSTGEKIALANDRILVTVGRRPQTDGWGIEAMNLKMSGPFIEVDETCATAVSGVWAIGDLVGEPMLAHKASAQGEMVAEIIAGKRRRFDPACIPAVCFTEPEIVSVGVTTVGDGQIAGKFPFQANGRALSMDGGEGGGFVHTIADKTTKRIIGIQAVGSHISELAGQFATLIELGATLDDVAGIVHAHPTLGEATHESALKALGHAIHI